VEVEKKAEVQRCGDKRVYARVIETTTLQLSQLLSLATTFINLFRHQINAYTRIIKAYLSYTFPTTPMYFHVAPELGNSVTSGLVARFAQSQLDQ
jgi:hypothetical protein